VGSPFAVPVDLGPLPGSGELSIPLGGIPLSGAVALPTTWQVYAVSPTSSAFVLSNPYELVMLGDGL